MAEARYLIEPMAVCLRAAAHVLGAELRYSEAPRTSRASGLRNRRLTMRWRRLSGGDRALSRLHLMLQPTTAAVRHSEADRASAPAPPPELVPLGASALGRSIEAAAVRE